MKSVERLRASGSDGWSDSSGLPPDEALRLAKLRLKLSGAAVDDLVVGSPRLVTAGISRHPWVSLAVAFSAGALMERGGGFGLLGRGLRLLAVCRSPARNPGGLRRHCRRAGG